MKAIGSAGMFTPGGTWVNGGPGAPTLVNSIWSVDGAATLPDDLWVITPDQNALREPCATAGAGVTLTNLDGGTSGLVVHCPSGSFTATSPFLASDILIGTNSVTGAMLTGWTYGNAWTWTGIIPAAGSPYPTGGAGVGTGWQAGDFIYRAYVWHYFIASDPTTTPPNRPSLYRQRAKPDPSAPVFVNDPAFPPELIQQYIEDLQVVFITDPNVNAGLNSTSVGNPSQYVQTQGFSVTGPTDGGKSGIQAVRVDLVAVSTVQETAQDGTITSNAFGPMQVENHTTVGAPDGYRRTLYTETFAMPNVNPGAM